MAALAAKAAGGAGPSDLFGLLASAGEHALAIPMRYAGQHASAHGTTGTTSGTGASSSGGSVTAPAGPQGPTGTSTDGSSSGGKKTGTGNGKGGIGAPGSTPPPNSQYDVSSDPVLQQVNAAMALADQNAQAAALRGRQQALLGYGDPALAAQILGANDPFVQAAGQNQEGTVQQLLRAYQEGLHNFDTGLDPSLAYSGYRIGQEGEIGQTYQDNLSKAAADIQAQLGGYTDTLNQALEADQQQRIQALADAYQRALQAALAGTGG